MRGGLFAVLCFLVGAKLGNGAFHPVDLSHVMADTEPDDDTSRKENFVEVWVDKFFDPVAVQIQQADAETNWDYNTNITQENQDATILSSSQSANFTRAMAIQLKSFNTSGNSIKEKRLYKKITELGSAALPEAELQELNKVVADMTSTYSTAVVCLDESMSANCSVDRLAHLDPNITLYLKQTRDPAKLKYIWKAWRDATGAKMRSNFTRYVELKNKAALLNGYADAGQAWRSNYAEVFMNYTDADVLRDLDGLWKQIEPLYQQLHAYVRRRLINQYPTEDIRSDGPIPAHLLGNMWGQQWSALLNFTQLFPNKTAIDVTEEMKRQNYTILQMFKLSESFQKGIGLKPMPSSFWEKSMMERPPNREVVCHASAWDMYRNNDVRIKMCTDVNMDDLIVIHHEMGHIQYYLQYESELAPFREGANSGFHEAVGDTLALSVSTPKHLTWLGLLKNNVEDPQSDLNYMFATALDKIVFLPFGYIMDRYRYDVFSGKIPRDKLNEGWWSYVLDYQGLTPPVPRTERDFDPGSKYHVSNDVEYMRYFISFVIQFQFHKALCEASGHTGPLYQCDINESKEAGRKLSDMLALGSSEPWPIALEKITGTRKMDASALLVFFEPLTQHLADLNARNNEFVGWKL